MQPVKVIKYHNDKDVNDYKRRLTVCINNNEYSKNIFKYIEYIKISYIPKYYALDILTDFDKINKK